MVLLGGLVNRGDIEFRGFKLITTFAGCQAETGGADLRAQGREDVVGNDSAKRVLLRINQKLSVRAADYLGRCTPVVCRWISALLCGWAAQL